MKIEDIVIGERFRQEMGDLQALAQSITDEGLLQPIGVTEKKELVFGERRLRACQLIGWTEIPHRTVHVTSILAGEYAENTLRKDFTASERVAIAAAVKRELGNRLGANQHTEPPNNCTDPVVGKETRQVAAERAGFGSFGTLNRAERVLDKGVPELVQAMDKGILSINRAADLAKLPPAEQRQWLAHPPPRKQDGRKKELQGEEHVTYRTQKAKPSDQRLDNALNILHSVAHGLSTLDLGECLACSPERRARWLKDLDGYVSQIRAFRRHLAATAVA